MTATLHDLEQRIYAIEQRNKKVALDKAWETSMARKIVIIIITYIFMSIYMSYLQVDRPWIAAITPTLGFFLSTLSLTWIKQHWIKQSK